MTKMFAADEKIARVAQEYAAQAVTFGAKFGAKLDGSDASIAPLEALLDTLAKDRLRTHPSDDRVWTFAMAFGSYLGETFRRNHGATWGRIAWNGDTIPGLQSQRSRILFWPWGKVQNRIVNGAEDDVRGYYADLLRRG